MRRENLFRSKGIAVTQPAALLFGIAVADVGFVRTVGKPCQLVAGVNPHFLELSERDVRFHADAGGIGGIQLTGGCRKGTDHIVVLFHVIFCNLLSLLFFHISENGLRRDFHISERRHGLFHIRLNLLGNRRKCGGKGVAAARGKIVQLVVNAAPVAEVTDVINAGIENDIQHRTGFFVLEVLALEGLVVECGSENLLGLLSHGLQDHAGSLAVLSGNGSTDEGKTVCMYAAVEVFLLFVELGRGQDTVVGFHITVGAEIDEGTEAEKGSAFREHSGCRIVIGEIERTALILDGSQLCQHIDDGFGVVAGGQSIVFHLCNRTAGTEQEAHVVGIVGHEAVAVIRIILTVAVEVFVQGFRHLTELVHGPLVVIDKFIGIFQPVILGQGLVECNNVGCLIADNAHVTCGEENGIIQRHVFHSSLIPPVIGEIQGFDGIEVGQHTVHGKLGDVRGSDPHHVKSVVARTDRTADGVVQTGVRLNRLLCDFNIQQVFHIGISGEYCVVDAFTGVAFGKDILTSPLVEAADNGPEIVAVIGDIRRRVSAAVIHKNNLRRCFVGLLFLLSGGVFLTAGKRQKKQHCQCKSLFLHNFDPF